MLPAYDKKKLCDPFKFVFCKHFNLSSNFDEPILTASRALVNKSVYHSIEYKMKLNSNSYTVNFNIDQQKAVGEIQFFFEYNNEIFCMINQFNTEPNARHVFAESSGFFYRKTINLISKFYFFVSKENMKKKKYVIVKAKDVNCKCFVVSTKNFYFITSIKYDFEHD
jgi:hypothetical protein